jgi:hypothetical protein
MPNSKTYLHVPYAEKDAAKALGAKWDAANKKWYVPAGVDPCIFSKWQLTETAGKPAKATAPSTKPQPLAHSGKSGVFTQPASQDFVAYDGETPPWE